MTMDVEALDLVTGETAVMSSPEAKRLCDRLDADADNGFVDYLGRRWSPGILEALMASGPEPETFYGIALARRGGGHLFLLEEAAASAAVIDEFLD